MNAVDAALQTTQLRDGRSLAFAEFGDPVGGPVLFFHGGNDSRLEAALIHEAARNIGLRVIAPDRPGYGGSDRQPGRAFLDWPGDVAQLVDALGLSRFALLGHSGGGPHALAVAYAMPQRVSACTLISSAAPPGARNRGMHPLFRLVNFFMAKSPALHKLITRQNAEQVVGEPAKFFRQWGLMQKADGRLFAERQDVVDMIAAEMQEAVRQGIGAILQEHPLYKQPWGFELSAIQVPVHIWHGLADRQASPAWSEYLVGQLPHARAQFVPDEGHFSVLVNHQVEILRRLFHENHSASAPDGRDSG